MHLARQSHGRRSIFAGTFLLAVLVVMAAVHFAARWGT
ncbi:hypothetical protein Bra1253DRAFT_00013 [Bradyrhizobium sp. WSM1253]|nr:hypothetical protein Bra1253DRAFT_00013 [Bradyrhizobium sp. WSM1253]